MFNPREYQSRCINATRDYFRQGLTDVMMVGPPGAGKGDIICFMATEAVKKGLRVLIAVHKRDLIYGANSLDERLVKRFKFTNFGFYLDGVSSSNKPLMLGTIQTISARLIQQPFDFIIIDEGHRVKAGQYQEFLAKYRGVRKVVFTATPFRYDKKGFIDDFQALYQFTTYGELVSLKYLVPTRVIAPMLAPDLDGLKLRGRGEKEFSDEELLERYDDERIYRAVVERWIAEAKDRKTIVFNINSKEHSRKTAEWFRKYKIDAESVDSSTPKQRRRELLKAFERGDFPVMCNIALFSEGISIDDVSCIVLNTAIGSPTKYIQTATRGSRPVWEGDDWKKVNGEYLKTDCLILDFGLNAKRHGFVDDYDVIPFSLKGTPPKVGEARMKNCPTCDYVVYVQTRVCPNCQHQFLVKVSDKNKTYADEVEWEEMDRMAAFYKRFADCSWHTLNQEIKFHPHLLRMAAKARGYRPTWAAYMAYQFGHTPLHPDGNGAAYSKGSFKNGPQILAFLKDCEQKKGFRLVDEIENYLETYERTNAGEGNIASTG